MKTRKTGGKSLFLRKTVLHNRNQAVILKILVSWTYQDLWSILGPVSSGEVPAAVENNNVAVPAGGGFSCVQRGYMAIELKSEKSKKR